MSAETHNWHAIYGSDALVRRRRVGHRKKLKRVGMLSMDRGMRILDIGCGMGEMLNVLAKEGFRSLVGIDFPNPDLAQKVSQGRPWRFLGAAAPALPFRPESFDFIICAHSLHHLGSLPDIVRLIKNAKACLRPGGTLVLIDHYDSLHLRVVLWLLRSPCGLLTDWSRNFRKQLKEEKVILYDYLSRWGDLRQTLASTSFADVSMRKDMFFFYFVARKGDAI